MRFGAPTPEELETLLEDSFVIRDGRALAGLFEDRAVLAVGDRLPEARGEQEIALLASAMWERGRIYVAEPPRVLQSRDTALVVSARAASVVRRGADGAWRYAISLLSLEEAK